MDNERGVSGGILLDGHGLAGLVKWQISREMEVTPVKSLKASYEYFESEYEKIHEYFTFSGLSFALVGTMQEQAKECAKEKKLQFSRKEISHSRADWKVGEIVLICEWVSIEEYANREKISVEDAEKQATEGFLGPVHIENDQKYVIWPKERQQDKDLPEFGKKTYQAITDYKIERTISISNPEQALTALGQYSDLDKVLTQSQQQLCPTCLLLYWTVFEAYVKDFIETLYFLHPEQVLKKYGKNEMTLKAIFDGSHRFTDIDSLKRRVLEEVLAKYDRENISKLIEFVGECYLDKGVDPFATAFIYKGSKEEGTKARLDQIRTIRNALIHDNGNLSEKEWQKIDMVSRKDETLMVLISEDELGIMYYTLKSIAHNLYRLTSKQFPEKD